MKDHHIVIFYGEEDGRDWWILKTDLEKAKDRSGVGYPKGRPRAGATANS